MYRSINKNDSCGIQISRRRPRPSSSLPRLSRAQSLGGLSPTVEESPAAARTSERVQNMHERPALAEYSESGKMSQLRTRSISTAEPHLATTQIGHDQTLYTDSNDSSSRSIQSKCASKVRVNGLTHEIIPERKRTSPEGSSWSPGTTRRRSVDSLASEKGNNENQSFSGPDGSTAMLTPLPCNVKILPQTPTHPEKNNQQSNIFSSSFTHTKKCKSRQSLGPTSFSKTPILTNDATSAQAALLRSISDLPSDVEKFPEYHPSGWDAVRTQRESLSRYRPENYSLDSHRENSFHEQLLATDNSVSWSSRHLISREHPHSQSTKSIPVRPEHVVKGSISNLDASSATRCKFIFTKSVVLSLADTKRKYVALGSAFGPTQQQKAPDSNMDQNSLGPAWKQELLEKKSEGKKAPYVALTLSHGRKSVCRRRPSKGALAENIPSAKENETHNVKLTMVGRTESSPKRSTSKPVGGTVRSMAARFDNVSQESSFSQTQAVNDKCQSKIGDARKLMSQDTKKDSAAKFSTPPIRLIVAGTSTQLKSKSESQSPTKMRSTPGRFRASISRLSHSLRPSPGWGKSDETPSQSVDISSSASAGLVDEHNKAQTTPSRSPPLKLGLENPLSQGTLTSPQKGLLITAHIKSAHTRSQSSTNRRDLEWERNMLCHGRYSQSLDSDHGSILYHQVRTLQKRIENRDEKIRGLQRQLETLHGADIGSICEQLRQAKRQLELWKDRADAAERRVAVVERFATRIKDLRKSIKNTEILNDSKIVTDSSERGTKEDINPEDFSTSYNHAKGLGLHKDRTCLSYKEFDSTHEFYDADGSQIAGDGSVGHAEVNQVDVKGTDISKATTETWSVAEEFLAVQDAISTTVIDGQLDPKPASYGVSSSSHMR
jgi:hypothetical protein